MCDLHKRSEFKTKTVYKIVYRTRGKYYAPFSGMMIETGKVELKFKQRTDVPFFQNYKSYDNLWYNHYAIGRTTGFAKKEEAMYFYMSFEGGVRETLALLKMKISDGIVEGSAKSMTRDPIMGEAIVYAGRRIHSFEDITTVAVGEHIFGKEVYHKGMKVEDFAE